MNFAKNARQSESKHCIPIFGTMIHPQNNESTEEKYFSPMETKDGRNLNITIRTRDRREGEKGEGKERKLRN